jgi:predicted acylesterase/phospholipase RssA
MTRRSAPRIGLALAGGGPLGAIHEIGALCALEEAVPGLDLNALDGYVGVSAGAFLAAGLANGMTPRQLCAAFIDSDGPAADRVPVSTFMRPALGEAARRAAALPRLALQAGWRALRGEPVLAALEHLGRALPAGLFSHAAIAARMRRLLAAPGRTDDFRALPRRLVLVATDLDSGEAAPFGLPGFDHVPISTAVAASAALPGLYTPVPIDGHWYVDGALKKTLHASVLLDLQLDLVLCLNPLVPFDASHPRRHRVLGAGEPVIPHLVEGGLPVVLSQTFRSLIHSRLELGMKQYAHTHPQTELLLFEPDHRDPALFMANTFDYSQRRALAEHAYQRTREQLRRRRSMLARQLARHGLALDDAVLDDVHRRLLRRGSDRRHALAARPLAPRPGPLPAQRPVRVSARPSRAMAPVLQRLDEVLHDLEGAVAHRAAQR